MEELVLASVAAPSGASKRGVATGPDRLETGLYLYAIAARFGRIVDRTDGFDGGGAHPRAGTIIWHCNREENTRFVRRIPGPSTHPEAAPAVPGEPSR